MGRRRVGDFDQLLEAWARWLADTRCSLGGGGGSLLARWMDAKGHLIFGGGGGSESGLEDGFGVLLNASSLPESVCTNTPASVVTAAFVMRSPSVLWRATISPVALSSQCT